LFDFAVTPLARRRRDQLFAAETRLRAFRLNRSKPFAASAIMPSRALSAASTFEARREEVRDGVLRQIAVGHSCSFALSSSSSRH